MDRDTAIGGRSDRFPVTHRSAVLALKSSDSDVRAMAGDRLVSAYWKPVYKYLRIKWKADNEAAKDWTQDYFAAAFERGLFERYEPARGTFRTFVRVSVDSYVLNERKAAGRLKRGGGRTFVPLDFDAAESEIEAAGRGAAPLDPERCFDREWTRHLFGTAVDELRDRLASSGRTRRLEIFERYDLDGSSDQGYAELATQMGIPVTQVTNELAAARREFRKLVLDRLRSITGSDEEFESEARRILGVHSE
jgi:RNA polymerase sigma factor (sigma-70 family)